MKLVITLWLKLIVLLSFSTLVHANTINQQDIFLSTSDIHFDPLYSCNEQSTNCPIINILNQKPITEWDTVFSQYDQLKPKYGRDTGYQLFQSTLTQFKTIATNRPISFLLVGGDLIVHDLKSLYFHYQPHATNQEYELFAEKVFSYIAYALKKAMEPVDVLMVVGNNDSFAEHYTSSPDFYKKMAPIWSQLIHDKTMQAKMFEDFKHSGYYSLQLKNKLKIIALNSTFFSPNYIGNDTEAHNQLNWLEKTLQHAALNQEKVIITSHIPPGVDVYGTVNEGKLALLWREEYIQAFYQLVKSYHQNIIAMLTSHLHADWMQSQQLENSRLFMASIPAISPQFGNNAAFKIFQLNTTSYQLEDYAVIYYPLTSKLPQWYLEYKYTDIYPWSLVDAPRFIQTTGQVAEAYKKYYSISSDSQPITKGKWLPFYWCAINHAIPKYYQKCMDGFSKESN